MARDWVTPQEVPFWTRRMLEWTILCGVILVLLLIFGWYVQVVRAQAERAGFRATLGALRTAMVIEYLHRSVTPTQATVVPTQQNPFKLLERSPPNYRGEMALAAGTGMAGGNWVFDPACSCVAYFALDTQGIDSSGGDSMLKYRVEGAPGVMRLTPAARYVWRGELID